MKCMLPIYAIGLLVYLIVGKIRRNHLRMNNTILQKSRLKDVSKKISDSTILQIADYMPANS